MKRRLFVAVALDEPARAACAAVAARIRESGFVARWVARENYHLTVAFLGGVEDERVAAIEGVLDALAPALSPFGVALDAVGAFPSERRPRVVWCGPAQRPPAFAAACGRVRGALAELGFAFDPHDDAHVTLARADGLRPLPRVAPPRAAQRADALTLYESFTEHAGPRYVALRGFALGARPSRCDGSLALAMPLPRTGNAERTMTLDEWAARLDALAAGEGLALPAHARRQDGNPVWSAGGRSAWVRVAEDDATLRAFFVPREAADPAVPDEERSHEKMYVRSDVGAREAARDIARFLAGTRATS